MPVFPLYDHDHHNWTQLTMQNLSLIIAMIATAIVLIKNTCGLKLVQHCVVISNSLLQIFSNWSDVNSWGKVEIVKLNPLSCAVLCHRAEFLPTQLKTCQKYGFEPWQLSGFMRYIGWVNLPSTCLPGKTTMMMMMPSHLYELSPIPFMRATSSAYLW